MDKRNLINRISIATGHLNGIKKMVEEDRECVDIITQIKAVKASLSGVENILLENHALELLNEKDANMEEKIKKILNLVLKNIKN
ncbi:metal-sensitive transcriptional regulator [Oceanivirga salmonicida]|uniref:metal-sensitive transcriptional regulator n=1 Tax=Oceanivirga salmonicida TaxID=1769291 RepID=UPI0008349CF6|nr:metal-sensitive transcriptional regulator [Oceanivirga salmonicida]